MKIKTASRVVTIFVLLALVLSTFTTTGSAAPGSSVAFTILHTNDFHGQLVGPPGSARVANYVNGVRTAVGAGNVLLVDGGDQLQGSLLSNLGDGTATGKGIPTIATYNAMGYNVATFGNHEFDWGQVNLGNRTTEALYPYVTANIVQNDTGNCATAGWTLPSFADAPYEIITVGVAPNTVNVAFIGVTTQETPTITISTATAGLCFKDPAQSISYYYTAMKAAGADVIVVLSHLGFTDAGGGYGLPIYGDPTLAARLNTAGTPVNLIIGGHSHTDVGGPAPAPGVATVGQTKIVQAANNGTRVGRADVVVGTDGSVAITWTRNVISNTDPQDPTIYNLISGPWDPISGTGGFANDPDYLAMVSTPVGYSSVDLPRLGRVVDNMMSTFIDDAIYNYLNTDTEPTNDVDIFINNGGGIRTDWCWNGADWVTSGCVAGTHAAGLLDYGDMFTILPFGNATMVGQMTGAQILEVLNHGPEIPYVAQTAGLKYKYFKYTDANPGPQPYAWGAYDVTVYDKATASWVPLDMTKVYNVGTNEFLAPGGGDGYNAFKYMTNITSWGDMLNAVNAYVSATYTVGNPYMGPNGNGTLDGRIIRDGDGDTTYEAGEIVPLTILHHNDSHGNLDKTSYIGYTQLATLIKQERLHNPTRTLLVSSGDNIQGDAMSYYFKTAPTGFAADGTPIVDTGMHIQPLIKAFNAMNYDAMTLGNHEFNYGKDTFVSILSQATFPILQANVTDDGSYGLAAAHVLPYIEKMLGDINVAILGIGNHRIPNYELASNIPGLTFTDPIAKAQELSTLLRPTNDVVIALTHIGFTSIPGSLEVDANVDTNLVANTIGIDAVIGGHSHSDPSKISTYNYLGDYKYLPTIVANENGDPVVVAQALRYNNTLGEVIMGLRDLGGGNYEVVSRTGRFIQLCAGGKTGTSPYSSCSPDTAEDPTIDSIITPYTTMLTAYNTTVIGNTTQPINTTNAYIAETNAANLQADAAVHELAAHGITDVDFHLSGAMTRPSSSSNWNMFPGATPGSPAAMKISDMFTLMPYENSLVVISMNGPQLKAVLERAYRNYYYYKYVPGYGGYSFYTTCMIDINSGGRITYNDLYPEAYDPNKQYVVSLEFDGNTVDFNDAATYYNVSTVNYLAAGSCNFNNSGTSLWPLSQIAHDTQYYVRDAVINYVTAMGTVSPAIEGRLAFISDAAGPTLTVTSPQEIAYLNSADLTIDFNVTDDVAGLASVTSTLDGINVTDGQVIPLYTFAAGTSHTLALTATDTAYNTSTKSVTFTVETTIDSMKVVVTKLYNDGKMTAAGYRGVMSKLQAASLSRTQTGKIAILNSTVSLIRLQSGRNINSATASLLITDLRWLILHLR